MKKTISILAFSLAGSALLAQNLNPTVEVTNTYDAAVAPAAKPRQEVAVPDSVLVFNLGFDYDALDKPYQGSYEFRPYRVELLPQGTVSTENKFYLRAGAGYAFHPELDLVWSPLRTDVFRMNLTAAHRSYFGNYWDVQPQTDFRITSGKDADRIIVLDEGRITDIGTHDELMQRSEIYRDVYQSQQKGGDE